MNIKKLAYNVKQANAISENQKNLSNVDELEFMSMLVDNGISFKWQKPFADSEKYVCVDFYIPDHNIVIEIDGKSHIKNKVKDKSRTDYIKDVHGVLDIIRIPSEYLYVKKHVILNNIVKHLKSDGGGLNKIPLIFSNPRSFNGTSY